MPCRQRECQRTHFVHEESGSHRVCSDDHAPCVGYGPSRHAVDDNVRRNTAATKQTSGATSLTTGKALEHGDAQVFATQRRKHRGRIREGDYPGSTWQGSAGPTGRDRDAALQRAPERVRVSGANGVPHGAHRGMRGDDSAGQCGDSRGREGAGFDHELERLSCELRSTGRAVGKERIERGHRTPFTAESVSDANFAPQLRET